jgi:HlyD family secretion protein
MGRHRVPARRVQRILPAAGCAAALMLMVTSCTGDEATRPQTASVERAAVTTGVSAVGSLSSVSKQNLGFPKGGQLTNVFVKVGDKVTAGQVLATVDDFAFQQQLHQLQGQLQSQQAMLNQLINSPAVDGAKDTLAQAEDTLDATKKQAQAVLDADETAIDSAQRQLDVDQKALDQAEDNLHDVREGCGDDDDDDDDDDKSKLTSLNPSCLTKSQAEQAVTAAKQKVAASKGTLDSAKEKHDVDKANGDLAVENAEQAVVNARNQANSASSDQPFEIEQQRGAVASAQAAVANAQRDVDNATLKAPVDGTVSAVNGVVGEFLSPGSGTSALAPGSGATIPGAGNPAGVAAAAAAQSGGAATPTTPGAGEFIVLDNIDAFQVVVPFNESDAATITPNQKVNVTVDAIPDLTLSGSVLSVAPSGTSIAGVISYYATVVVNGSDPRLKDGQTVRATVVTDEINNVLTVPSTAVRQENGRSMVTVVEPDGVQKSVSFQPGVVGADRTQVLSGLREGQQVLLPVAR